MRNQRDWDKGVIGDVESQTEDGDFDLNWYSPNERHICNTLVDAMFVRCIIQLDQIVEEVFKLFEPRDAFEPLEVLDDEEDKQIQVGSIKQIQVGPIDLEKKEDIKMRFSDLKQSLYALNSVLIVDLFPEITQYEDEIPTDEVEFLKEYTPSNREISVVASQGVFSDICEKSADLLKELLGLLEGSDDTDLEMIKLEFIEFKRCTYALFCSSSCRKL